MTAPPVEGGRERPRYNEGIEDCFMEVSVYAASIDTHYQTGGGVIRGLYEKFYFHLRLLNDLTCDLIQMNSSIEARKALEDWLKLPPLKSSNTEIEARCKLGLKVFRDYKIALNSNGVLSLSK
jgi:hypothetical protein